MRVLLFLCLLVLDSSTRAAFDVFLRVTPSSTPISGGSTDPLYSGWIKVLSFESGLQKNVTLSAGTFNPGPTGLTPITLVKTVDAATPFFFERLAAGTQLATVKMVVVLQSALRVEVWDIEAQNAFFTSQTFSTEASKETLERITFAVGRVEWSYIQLSPAGDPMTEIFSYWNVVTGTGASGTRAPNFPGGLDTDSDGIPDGWEVFYGLNKDVKDGTLDTDGDSLDNLHEYIAHTNPRLPQSVLRVTAIQQAGGQNYLLTWQSVAGLTYRIESASSLGGQWSFVKNVASSGTGTTSTTVAGAPPRRFFRVLTPP